ncbi:hypothetical protein NW767_007229 [Fusarium falciforme]|uniref:Repetitive proline-rich cell wall protein n=1 Tax=Fusarium falciforme TaxID=195108 RepID=A0A9W8V626_9HYPO|nr:hypothetical protein NW755_000931 [Fusarium falciforme]KAJ4200607.1 hypothetical protein NW767_007229 [Fusarium falciforme]KAJ4261907.1 hypothetical protein NW757_000179 [Fusarium falciforme]
MKFGAALLVLATTALAQNIRRRDDYGEEDYGNGGDEYGSGGEDYGDGGDDGYGDNGGDNGGDDGGDYGYGGDYGVTKTAVTYTTVTTCPVTYTHTKEGTTYCVTELATSTIVVTETKDVHVTVKKPDVTKEYTDVEYATRTTVCPVTVTETIGGEVITKVYTTTSVIQEVVKTTEYEKVKQPDVTKHETEVEYTTRTTVCPVTITKTIAGEVITEVYTTTSVIEEKVQTTEYEHVKQPDVTKYATDVIYYTKTSLCPVTITKTIAGEVITEVYTSTDYIVEKVETTIYDQVKKPDVTKQEHVVVYNTKYSLCPITVTKTIEGEVVTNVYTSTSVIVEKVETTIPAYETIIKTVGQGEVVTQYSKIVYTVGGGTVYETVAPQPTTVQLPETEVVTQPEVTIPATPTEAPVEVPTGAAAANKAPVLAFMAGVVGAIALF